MFEEDEETSDRDVFPQSVRRECACAPDANSTSRKTANDVDASWVQHALRVVVDLEAYIECATHDLIRRRFENATFGICASVNSKYVSARRNSAACAA